MEERKWMAEWWQTSIKNNDPEVKKSVAKASSLVDQRNATLEERIEHFSDWYRARQAVALCSKYIQELKETRKQRTKWSVPSVSWRFGWGQKINHSRRAVESLSRWVKIICKGSRRTGILLRSRNCEVTQFNQQARSVHGWTRSLHVRSCLKHADLSDKVKHPVILPKGRHMTSLIIKYYHKRSKHQGKGITLNKIRSHSFGIIGGSSTASNVIDSCVSCRKLRVAVIEQMSDLPKDWLESCPPFTYYSVD